MKSRNRFEIRITDRETGTVETVACRSTIVFADCDLGVQSMSRIQSASSATRLILSIRKIVADILERHPELATALERLTDRDYEMIVVDPEALREQAGGGQDG